jgi:hypothetical protein
MVSPDGRGTGEFGLQVNLPVSHAILPQLVAHGNAGFTAVRTLPTNFSLGASAIWLALPAFNVMLEGIWLTDGTDEAAFLNPGVRWAFNFASGLQIVPGIAYTIGVGPSRGDDALFLYLISELRAPVHPAISRARSTADFRSVVRDGE